MKRLLFVLALYSCTERQIYLAPPVVPAPVQPYVDVFIAEALARGYKVDFKGLVIVLADSIPMAVDADGNWQRYEAFYEPEAHKIYIQSGSSNWLAMPAELVCHELGHAILKRPHDFARLPDGSQKSLMGCPCAETNNGWSEPGHAQRRQYYFDELFNPATPVPPWAR